MNFHQTISRVEQLFSQSRFSEARQILETFLNSNPTDFFAQYLYVETLIRSEEVSRARLLSERLLAENPHNTQVLAQSIEIDLIDKLFDKAKSKLEILGVLAAGEASTYILKSRFYFAQNNYDRALQAANEALKLEPNNLAALNLKIAVDNILGDQPSNDTIQHALHLNPENPNSIALHAQQLLNQGKIEEALVRVSEALQKDPNNQLAQAILAEAMKSRFMIYRWFYRYQLLMTKLTSKGSWTFIIGSYILFRIFSSLSESHPIFMVGFYLLLVLFLLSWVIGPIFNLYLYFNKYGKQLLDNDEQRMAQQVGISLGLAIVFLILYIITQISQFSLAAIICSLMAIPLGSYLKPTNPKNRKHLTYFTYLLMTTGLISIILNGSVFLLATAIGIFIYQIYLNNLMIKENARVID